MTFEMKFDKFRGGQRFDDFFYFFPFFFSISYSHDSFEYAAPSCGEKGLLRSPRNLVSFYPSIFSKILLC